MVKKMGSKTGKRVLMALTVIMVLAFAGSALAYGGRHHGGGYGYGQQGTHWGPGYGMGPGGGYMMGPGGRGPQGQWNIDVPQNIRDKQVEAEKLMVDLRAEMTKSPIDKAKATDLYRKHRALRNEISEWFFLQRLEFLANPPAAPATPPAAPAQPQ